MRKKNDARQMNSFLQRMLMATKDDIFGSGTHFIPQYDFVFNESGKRMVEHVLRFENLQEEFDALMAHYSLNISLPSKHGQRHRSSDATLGIKDLSNETVRLIEARFGRDFELGNYTVLSRKGPGNYTRED